ncbi:MAG: type I restriction endonuclease subunit R [Acidobacteria bacterium]|nr:type I restriction endonuclease subunit R [Acidobacteriota bacterium]
MAESTVETAALEWLCALGYTIMAGPTIAPGEVLAERASYDQVVLEGRMRAAVAQLNPAIPAEAQEDAIRKALRTEHPTLVANNRAFHRMLVDGVDVEYRRADGTIAGDKVRLIDFDDPAANDWLAVNQFTVVDGQHNRRPDIVIFINGLPLAVVELKNPADEEATVWKAFQQLQTYKAQIPDLFTYNEALIASDGLEARIGSLTADKERFMPWRTIEGQDVAPAGMLALEVLMRGVFDQRRFLDLVRYGVVFDRDDKDRLAKILAGYHQFHAVQTAVDATVAASRPGGDRRCGVVWHTQGSGKSLTMVFFAGRIIVHPAMENPTIVVLTDRNDLDGQLFDTFSRCQEILRQKPVQAESRAQLRELLAVASGGVVFTTIQKFFPEEKGDKHPLLSERRNIVVIADEAHRSQYDFIDGFARHMRDALPNASFIGFTGTPIELTDKNTRAVFGDYISVYDIQRAVQDGATVPIYYESRLAKLDLDTAELPQVDAAFDEVTETEEQDRKEKLKSKWAALEAIVGAEKRVELIAADLVRHFEQRLETLDGKAMIVCMSRRICVELYSALVKLRPAWHHEDDDKGALKVVMTGSASDPDDYQPHLRSKARLEELRKQFKKPSDPFKIVIVRDMWLTGFDAPCLHTMYIDKPMRGHGLMQGIARVNRVFKDKPGGLVVDYLGLADQLKAALATYTESGGQGKTAIDKAEAVAVMLEKHEICCGLFAGFDWSLWTSGTGQQKLGLLPPAQEHILAREEGKARLVKAVADLSAAFALAVPDPEALGIRDDVAFFQAVKAALVKSTTGAGRSEEDLDQAIRQIVSRAIATDGVVDLFSAAGLKKPDISILSEEFLAEVRGLPQRNLAVELLRKLLNDELKMRTRTNIVKARQFSEMLEAAIRKYHNRAVETAQVIEELIELAKEMRAANERGGDLGLTSDELAFYDALEVNDSAVAVLGEPTLKAIARELVAAVRRSARIDWTIKESVRAEIRVMVKRILKKYGYPPDKQERATITVLEQAEVLCKDWAT